MKKQTKHITEGTTNKYLIGLSVMAMALLFFLFSGFIFGDEEQSEVQQTPVNEPLNLQGAGELTIKDWVYNPTKNLMVVTININKSTALLDESLSFKAQEKEHPKRDLPTHVEYNDESRYVISIQQVSPSFDVMALDVNKEENIMIFTEKNNQNSLKGGEEKKELARIYTDQRKVKMDKQLNILTEQEYEVAAVSEQIEESKETIKEKKKSIQAIDERIKELDQKTVELESELLYDTEEEKKQTESRIHHLENEKDQINQEAAEHELTIQTIVEKIEMLEEKREMISK
ncbi:hypothetical protein GCM10007216_30490 [Thalassobacillus devorans]|uniref:Uncharacterized protein n=1 Tax=Thalassobacillus devorans TaxID=279813 RepID=A0ABQ1PI33_9BACI|nr:hypothetical protein [Thalassobacillus devorans]NIK30009.1 DNA repair exonuclease SbcCD ATPase subunit [Thalassobacillus devorans]GGC97609.1 hypothetical protein GCM10007216_30490 [Thalassobacillus devorans]